MKPLKKTTMVPLTCQEAFDLFIREIDTWWPKDSHSAFGSTAKLSVEPHKGGTIAEIAQDGRTKLWGRIIAWAPGEFLAFTWFPDTSEDEGTVVAVSFTLTEAGTRLDLTHGDAGILGATADAVSTTYMLGWDLVLGCYCYACSQAKVFV